MQSDHFKVLVAVVPSEMLALFPGLTGHAVVVSDRLVQENVFTSTFLFRGRVVCWDRKFGREEVTRDIPGVDPDALRTLDTQGIAQPGTVVRRGNLLVGKVSPMSKWEFLPEEKILHAVFGRASEDVVNNSLVYPHQEPGTVVRVKLESRVRGVCSRCGDVLARWHTVCPICGDRFQTEYRDPLPANQEAVVELEVLLCRDLHEGDFLQDEGGHAHTVARIIPAGEMPRLGGRSVDLLLHPEASATELLTDQGLLRVGQGKEWSERWGHRTWRKTTLIREHKLQARATGDYDPITAMPTTDLLQFPAQRVTRETADALFRSGYQFNLAELLNLKADNLERDACRDAVRWGGSVLRPYPEAVLHLGSALRAAGFKASLDGLTGQRAEGIGLTATLSSSQDVRSWSQGEVRYPDAINMRTYRPEAWGLLSERIFGPEGDWECACGKYRGAQYNGTVCNRCGVLVAHSRVRRRRLGHICLARPVVHPWFFGTSPVLSQLLGLDRVKLNRVIRHERYVVIRPGNTGWPVGHFLFPDEYTSTQSDETLEAETGASAVRELLARLNRPGLEGVVLDVLPILPAAFRPPTLDESALGFRYPRLHNRYARVVKANLRLKHLVDLQAPEVIIRHETTLLQNAVNTLFDKPGGDHLPERCSTLADEVRTAVADLFDKTVDFSARGAVVPDESVVPGTVGLPRLLARTLYEPLVAGLLFEAGSAATVEDARRLASSEAPGVEEALVMALSTRPLLAIAPSLRALPFRPVLVEGEALRLNPVDGGRLCLDYGGAMLTLHLPLTTAAICELQKPHVTPGNDTGSNLDGLTPAWLVQAVVQGETLPLSPLDGIALGTSGLQDIESMPSPGATRASREFQQVESDSEVSSGSNPRWPLSRLGLTSGTRRLLQRQGIEGIEELLKHAADRLLDEKHIWQKSLQEIRNKLCALGLQLPGD
jgi:RNA polymerase Rpb2, domain 6/RNA polymerase Rpb1, domain 1/Bacterial RNA polymerase, alpha chain C terminal domain